MVLVTRAPGCISRGVTAWTLTQSLRRKRTRSVSCCSFHQVTPQLVPERRRRDPGAGDDEDRVVTGDRAEDVWVSRLVDHLRERVGDARGSEDEAGSRVR